MTVCILHQKWLENLYGLVWLNILYIYLGCSLLPVFRIHLRYQCIAKTMHEGEAWSETVLFAISKQIFTHLDKMSEFLRSLQMGQQFCSRRHTRHIGAVGLDQNLKLKQNKENESHAPAVIHAVLIFFLFNEMIEIFTTVCTHNSHIGKALSISHLFSDVCKCKITLKFTFQEYCPNYLVNQ